MKRRQLLAFAGATLGCGGNDNMLINQNMGFRGGAYTHPAPPITYSLDTMRGQVAWLSPRNSADYTTSTAKNKTTGANVTLVGSPPVDPTGINGFPAWHVDGTMHGLGSESAVYNALKDGSPHTIYVVTKLGEADAARAFIGTGHSGVASARTRYWGQSSSSLGAWGGHVSVDDAANSVGMSTVWQSDAINPHVHCWHSDGNVTSMRLDGNEGADPWINQDNTGTQSPNQWGIFCRPDNVPDTKALGWFGDIIVCNVEHTQAERKGYCDLLAANYGFAAAPLPTVTPDPTIVDVVALCLSQSNASGYGYQGSTLVVDSSVLEWRDIVESGVVATALQAQGEWHDFVTNTNRHGVEISLARLLRQQGLANVVVWKYTYAGNPVKATWYPVTPVGNHWPQVVASWNNCAAAIAATYPGSTLRVHVVTFNGEAEAPADPTNAVVTGFEADLTTCITTGVRGSGSTNLNLPTAKVHIGVLDWPQQSQPEIAAAQRHIAATITDCYAVELSPGPRTISGIHFDTEAFWIHAQNFARSILNTI